MKIILVAASLLSLALGMLLGRYLFPTKAVIEKVATQGNIAEIRASNYKFISPLLECELSSGSREIKRLVPLQNELSKIISREKANGGITDASVYFRDLNNGPWIGVNEHASFSPASLLKLPVLMAYYKKAEKDPSILEKKIKYDEDLKLLDQTIEPTNSIEKGKQYSIQELLERMMIYSDNAALVLLEENIEPELIDKITLDLGVETATDNSPEDFMTVRGYSSLFRILYNASYLERDLSERALFILSNTAYKGGIVAGVPKSVVVSHKFGERILENGVRQLHDCGIVYYPKHPYLLCIMTRGSDFNKLQAIIAQISALTYREVESERTN